jgi:UDP-glucose 4-epimerase
MIMSSKLENKKVLLTGGCGFIGKHVVKSLEGSNNELIILDKHKEADVNVDITNWNILKDAPDWSNIDLVYHLAALTSVVESFRNPRETYEVNVLGTLNILELCRIHDIKKMVFLSSYLYGEPEYLPIDEKHPIKPTNPYAMSKYLAEQLCKRYSEDYGLKCVVLKPFNIYGEGQSKHLLFSTILTQMVNGRIEIKDPVPKRDYVYISDLIDAMILSGDYNPESFDIFNVGSGKSYSVKEIVNKLIAINKKRVSVTYLNERRKNEIMNTIADIKHINDRLGWEPKISIDEGLKKTFEWYKNELEK